MSEFYGDDERSSTRRGKQKEREVYCGYVEALPFVWAKERIPSVVG